jgi:hypothetical protein
MRRRARSDPGDRRPGGRLPRRCEAADRDCSRWCSAWPGTLVICTEFRVSTRSSQAVCSGWRWSSSARARRRRPVRRVSGRSDRRWPRRRRRPPVPLRLGPLLHRPRGTRRPGRRRPSRRWDPRRLQPHSRHSRLVGGPVLCVAANGQISGRGSVPERDVPWCRECRNVMRDVRAALPDPRNAAGSPRLTAGRRVS